MIGGQAPTSVFKQRLWLGAVLALAIHWPSEESRAGRVEPTISVATPYVELHSGPGRGFPVFHTVERGGTLVLVKRRTDWVKVRTEGDVEGWAHRQAVERAAAGDAEAYTGRAAAIDDYLSRRVEAGFAESQNAWIRNTLETSTGAMKFVVSHHPAWSSDGIHGSQAWMQGDHLFMADAVFAGHAHVYERLHIGDTPFFTSGIGGKSFYYFAPTPLPESQFRYNHTFGVLRVTKNNTGALCEFFTIDDGTHGANGGVLLDSHKHATHGKPKRGQWFWNIMPAS